MRNAWSSSKVVHSKQFSNHSLPLRFCCACYVDTDGFCCTVTFWDTPKSNDTARLKRSVVSTQQRKVGNQTKHSRGERKIFKKSACSKPRQRSNIQIDTREKESLKKPRGGTTNHLVVLWDMRRSSEETYSTSFISHCITWGDTWTPTHLSAMKTSNTHICFLISSTLKWTQTTGLEPTRRVYGTKLRIVCKCFCRVHEIKQVFMYSSVRVLSIQTPSAVITAKHVRSIADLLTVYLCERRHSLTLWNFPDQIK